MATYQVQSPDGAIYRIDGPDGADPSQVIAQVISAHQSGTGQTAPSASGGSQGFDLASAVPVKPGFDLASATPVKPTPTIDSPAEAQSVARLIQSGRITGAARDTAMQALRDFDTRYTASSPASPQKVNPANDLGGNTLQVWNPAQLWNSKASNFDTGIPLGQAGQNVLAGSGKFFTDLGLGARQIGARVMDAVGPRTPTLSGLVTGQPTSRTSVLEAAAADKRALDDPLMKTTAGRVGQIGAGLVSAYPLAMIPGANTYLGAGAIGAGLGALTPTTANDSRLFNTALGGAAGAAGKLLGNTVGNWLTSRPLRSLPPSSSVLTPAQQQAAAAGQQLGMRLTPGQASGSEALQQLESKLESQPWTSSPFNAVKSTNSRALNRAVAQAIGENSDSVDSTVLDAADSRLGNVFQSVRSPSRIVMQNPQGTTQALDAIDQQFRGLLPGNGSIRAANPLVADLESLTQQGSVNGQQLGSLSSKLGRAAYKQMTGPSGDRDLAQALYAVKDHADDLLESTLTGSERAAYAAARQQYRNLMLITSRPGIVNPSTGNVSGAALASKLQQADKAGFTFGRNSSDMYNAARFAQAFKPIVGNSGTATRSFGPGDLLHAAWGIPLNVASRLYAGRLGQSAAPALMRAGQALPVIGSNAAIGAGRLAGPVLQNLPSGAGGLLPYLAQQ